MQRITIILVLICCLVVPFSGALTATRAQTQLPGEPLTNTDIVAMVRTKLSADEIITKIKTSRCHFDTVESVLAELKYKGIPPAVLAAMYAAPFGAPAPPGAEAQQAVSSQEHTGQPTNRSSAGEEADVADVLLERPTSPNGGFNINYGSPQSSINPFTGGMETKKKSRWKTAFKWIGAGAVLGAMVYLDAKYPSATARCRDGSYSYSQHRQGTCSWNGGVMYWLR